MSGFLPSAKEQEQVQKEHDAKIDAKCSDLVGKRLHQFLPGIERCMFQFADAQDAQCKSDVNKIEAHFEKFIGGHGYLLIAFEDIQHEDAPVLEQCACHILRKDECDWQVDEVGQYDLIFHDQGVFGVCALYDATR